MVSRCPQGRTDRSGQGSKPSAVESGPIRPIGPASGRTGVGAAVQQPFLEGEGRSARREDAKRLHAPPRQGVEGEAGQAGGKAMPTSAMLGTSARAIITPVAKTVCRDVVMTPPAMPARSEVATPVASTLDQ